MCKIGFAKTKDGTAYEKALNMIKHQEQVVAGQSTGLAYIDKRGVHLRKAVGKVINFKAKYPDTPRTNMCISHSRWATTGAITEANQHPISIMYKGKRIGYGVHNGVWRDYVNFEYMRNKNLSNVTDSALLFTIFSTILEKYGDSHLNRRKALGTMRKLVKSENNNNFVLMFNDGQVIFSGNVLTYTHKKDTVGIMTFGLPHKVNVSNIYEIKGMRVLRFEYQSFDYVPQPKPPKTEIKNTNKIKNTPTQTTLNKYHMLFDGMYFKLYHVYFTSQAKAQAEGEKLKERHGMQYRTIKNEKDLWALYLRGKRK